MKLKDVKYKGSTIKVGKDKTGKVWATAWRGLVIENAKTKKMAVSKAKKRINKFMKLKTR